MTGKKTDAREPIRCGWAKGEQYIRYHDEEWGVPVHDDRTLFEFLILEGAQAGLSWSTILNKRENYRRVGGRPRLNQWRSLRQVPARTAESDSMSKDLQRRSFKFAGSTICYAFMQAVGMVNDHLVDCIRYRPLASQR